MMDCLERIERLQQVIKRNIELTEKKILFLLENFEFPEELRREALEALGKTEDENNSCKSG